MSFVREFVGSDPVRRAVRTFVQAFVAVLALSFTADSIPSVAEFADVLRYAGWAGVVSVVSLAHNEVEDFLPRLDTRAKR